jgi:adenylate cyclase
MVALFVVLTVPVFFATIALTYLSNEAIARADADALIERFRNETIEGIQNMFNPIKTLVRSAAMVGTQQHDFYTDNRSLRYLLSLLLDSNKLVSVYVGLSDGSFRQARQLSPTAEIDDKRPPADVRFASLDYAAGWGRTHRPLHLPRSGPYPDW